MSTRKIIDAKQNGEKVWLKGHAQAIYMSDGSTVEDAINSIDIPSLDEYVTETELNDKGFLTEHQNISHLASRNWVESQGYAHQEDLLEISFNDIQDSPISIDDSSELNLIDENGNVGLKVNNEGLFVKDVIADGHKLTEKVDKVYVDNSIAELVDGAPETLNTLNELAAALKDNADIVDVINQSISSKQDIISDIETIRQGAAKGTTALQSYTEQYKGTVTGVKINGTTKSPSSGVVDLGTVITSHQTLKTINGESIVGEGDIVIEGGGGYAEVNHGTNDTTFTLTPNTFHVWDEVASLDLSFAEETAGVMNEYLFQFTSGATATTLTLPDGLKWANDTPPTIAENMIYQISILKGLASVLEFSNKGLFPITLYFSSSSNEVYAKVYQELVSRGVPGTLESGLLFVDYKGTVGEVTTYNSVGPGLLIHVFDAPVYHDIYLCSDGSMSAIFND